MYNKVIIMGNLTRDIELKYSSSGFAIATMGLASNRRFKKQDGSQGEEACFVDVKLFGRTAEIANQYLKKGSKVLIEGRLTLESWTDQSGSKKSKHTITAESMQMLDSKNDSNDNLNHTENTNTSNTSQPQIQGDSPANPANMEIIETIPLSDEEIPF